MSLDDSSEYSPSSKNGSFGVNCSPCAPSSQICIINLIPSLHFIFFNAISYPPAQSSAPSPPLSGYGAYGVLIKTFWHDWENSNGMNYAHNEVLQLLLDGGIILLVAYIAMCIVLLRNRQQGVTKNVAYWFNAFLIAFLAVGICESLTEYNYFYIFLIINLFLPSILNRSGEYDYKKSMINGVR